MRILFQTPEAPGASIRRPDGVVDRGRASFAMVMYEPGERQAGDGIYPLSEWIRMDGRGDGAIVFPLPPHITEPPGRKIPPAVIPRSVFKDLPPDTLIFMTWRVVTEAPQ